MSQACLCGCGQLARKRFVHGHYGKWLKKQRTEAVPQTQDVVTFDSGPIVDKYAGIHRTIIHESRQAPPPHPLPYDHGKYIVAEEPAGTDLTQPWVLDYCLECRLPTWTHNAATAAKHETLCESCAYQLLVELTDKRVGQQNRTRTTFDPFST